MKTFTQDAGPARTAAQDRPTFNNIGRPATSKALLSQGRTRAKDGSVFHTTGFNNTCREYAGHPTQKPLELLRRFIANSSGESDLVLDPFLGSGTTAVAAKQLGRDYIGIEMSAEYVKIAESRLAEVDTNQGFTD